MPDNNFDEIRNGLTNYVFSCLAAMPYEGDQAKHFLVSILEEEALKIGKDESGKFNMFAIKPLLRACNAVFTERIDCLKEIESSLAIQQQIEEYALLITTIDKLINTIKE